MLISTTATVTWNSKNKKHYTDLGYNFTKMKDKFEVSIDHLTKGSSAFVKVKCDYCSREYSVSWEVYQRMKNKSIIDKDACSDCLEMKVAETIKVKYGSSSQMFYASNDKRTSTNISRYGCSNPFGNELIQEKIKNTNIERYGVAYTMQNPETVEKSKQTCMEKYGVSNYGKIYSETHSKEKSSCWKGGPAYSRVERSTIEYRQWRSSVFVRDLYTCQKCGIKSRVNVGCVELHAHHISNWKDNEDLRYDVDNGITLCDECHYKFHSIFGKRFNNEDQLNEFINNNEIDEKIC